MSELQGFNIKAYCGWTKCIDDLCESASGGIFYILAKKIIQDGGYVAGAIYSADYKSVNHILSNRIEDIKKMRGSKYCQSKYSDIISLIEEKCSNGVYVMFSGTPCQCYAVKNRVKSEYLICIDLICNGLQDRRILESEINRIESRADSRITYYTMRYKKNNIHLPLYMRATFNNGINFEEQFYQTALGKIYGSRLALQKSCYNCKFKGIDRIGDITLGDYRGFHSLKDKEVSKCGASTILINTERGLKLLDSIANELELIQANNLVEVVWSNNRIVISGCRPSKRNIDKFWKVFNEKGIEVSSHLSQKYLSRWGNRISRLMDKALLIKYIILNNIK